MTALGWWAHRHPGWATAAAFFGFSIVLAYWWLLLPLAAVGGVLALMVARANYRAEYAEGLRQRADAAMRAEWQENNR